MLSSKNVLNAKIIDVKTQGLISLIYAKLDNDKSFKAMITSDSANDLGLKPNSNAIMIFKANSVIVAKNECSIRTSCSNELNGKVISINEGSVYAIVDVDCLGVVITASITKESLNKMQIKLNDNVNVLIKATNVVVGIKE